VTSPAGGEAIIFGFWVGYNGGEFGILDGINGRSGGFVLRSSDALPSTIADEIDRARADFETAWLAGQKPQIEDYLEGKTDAHRVGLLTTILAAELELRAAGGESPTPEEYLARFPADVDSVRGVFEHRAGEKPPTEPVVEYPQAAGAPTVPYVSGASAGSGGDGFSCGDDTGDFEPARIGRYRVIGLVGQGGFGRVFFARDDELGRPVAIKVTHAHLLEAPYQVEAFLSEARLAARLNHPSIVTVHDVGREEGVGPFMVMEHVAGQSLDSLLRAEELAPDRLARLLAGVADAIHHAHGAGLVHRDLKPGNILIDAEGEPHVTDFGMAVTEDLQRLRSGEIAGTPHFMAPEQTRGETHRLDGRTDVWGLGIIFYLGLTRRLPFVGHDRSEIFDQIAHRDPTPPRQIDSTIPRELERICLKCLAKPMYERYPSAADLAEDLRAWLAAGDRFPRGSISARSLASAAGSVPKVVPKGLRSFDVEDADFFLALLPGPRDRDGLPEPVRFWKTRIEEVDDERTFSVGVIYGPSGCGKTSLIKAGLLPCLAEPVLPIYLEASTAGTEARILAAVRRACPGLPDEWTLTEAIAGIREGRFLARGGKILIVLDQFEQWLHAHPVDPAAELTRALRQCDGRRVQGLILVRDEFWMSISRFMRALEVRLVEGRNSAAVELFDPVHARCVLAEFGRAWDRLPAEAAAISAEQDRFLDRAIAELGRPHEGRISPVRLGLFAEMVRARPWIPATLKDVGGTEGLGVRFLEETFCGSSAPLAHRLHERAAREVLKALLPDSSTNFKGAHRSGQELIEAAGYGRRADEFADLIRILDSELRLITPAEPVARSDEPDAPAPPGTLSLGEARYQLAHDELVPSVRQWLNRKQQETRRGRAELRLAERASHWNARPERRQLPSIGEWLEISLRTRRRDWTAPQTRMMQAATRRNLTAALTVAVVLCTATLGALALKRRIDREQKVIEARGLIAQLRMADIGAVPAVIASLDGYRPWVDRPLAELAVDPRQPAQVQERASLALLAVDPSRAGAILDQGRIFQAPPEEVAVLARLLYPYRSRLVDRLWDTAARTAKSGERHRLMRAAGLLAEFDPAGAAWREIAAPVAEQLVHENVLQLRAWSDLLGPVRQYLLDGLMAVFRDPLRPQTERSIATGVLRQYTLNDPAILIELVKDADPDEFEVLAPDLDRYASETSLEMSRELARTPGAADSEPSKERLARRQVNAAIVLLGSATPDAVWPALKFSPEPRVRSQLICNMARRGVDPEPLVDRLGVERDPTIRRALLLALADYKLDQIASEQRSPLIDDVAAIFQDDPDPGNHGAARCVLSRWGGGDRVRAIEQNLRSEIPSENRGWYVTPNGHTMVLVTPQPAGPGRSTRPGVNAPFAIADREVTVDQFLTFSPKHYYYGGHEPKRECPMNILTWYDAAAYCRWLSEAEHVPEDEMCYPPVEEIKSGMVPYPNYLERTGYRLPTEAEWTAACRAGTTTLRYFGQSSVLSAWYAWSAGNSAGKLRPVGMLLPNDLGLFDMMGNALEWCQDGLAGEGDPIAARPVLTDQRRILKGGWVNSQAESLQSGMQHNAEHPTLAWNSVSFRLARTLRPPP
jgi:hypothetical protein